MPSWSSHLVSSPLRSPQVNLLIMIALVMVSSDLVSPVLPSALFRGCATHTCGRVPSLAVRYGVYELSRAFQLGEKCALHPKQCVQIVEYNSV